MPSQPVSSALVTKPLISKLAISPYFIAPCALALLVPAVGAQPVAALPTTYKVPELSQLHKTHVKSLISKPFVLPNVSSQKGPQLLLTQVTPIPSEVPTLKPEEIPPSATMPSVESASESETTPSTATVPTVSEVPSGLSSDNPPSPLPAPPVIDADANEDNSTTSTATKEKSRLLASKVSYQGSLILAEGTPTTPVQFSARGLSIRAQKLTFDTSAQTVVAQGNIFLARDIQIVRKELRARLQDKIEREEVFTSTATGNDLFYDFKAQTGSLDRAGLVLPAVNVDAATLQINGASYSAQNVTVRPGGLTEAERKIYGTPPLSLRARSAVFTAGLTPDQNRLRVSGASLYFRSTKLFSLPNSSFKIGGSGGREPGETKIAPRISTNSTDRFLLITEFLFPLDKKNPDRLDVLADLGYSLRVGFRGGASLQSRQNFGLLALNYRISDVISTQLTNRIELDRKPEFAFSSAPFLTFNLPGKRRAGFSVDAGAGDYTERAFGSGGRVSSSRTLGRINFSTRLARRQGPFLNLFASRSNYSMQSQTYDASGFQIGYEGQLLPRVRGQISVLRTNLRGNSPFRFDRVEIAREARATVDIQLSPRWIVPLDLRYDLDAGELRDETYGLLRSYKNFAYGVVYQSARRDLRLELRSAF